MSMEDALEHLTNEINIYENLESKTKEKIKNLKSLAEAAKSKPATVSHFDEEIKAKEKGKQGISNKLEAAYRGIAPLITIADSDDNLDGVCALALVAHIDLADRLFISVNKSETSQEIESVVNNERIYMMSDKIYKFGLTVDEQTVKDLIAQGKELYFYDNHETALWMNSLSHCIVDVNRSSAKIFYDEYILGTDFDSETIERIVKGVDAKQLWIKDSQYFEDGLKLSRLLTAYKNRDGYLGLNPFWETITRMIQNNSLEYTKEEEALIQGVIIDEEKSYKEAKKSMTTHTDSRGIKFGVYYNTGHSTIVSNRILVEDPSIQYLCIRNKNNNDLNVVSNGYDLLQFAGADGTKTYIWIKDYSDFDPEIGPLYNLQERGIRALKRSNEMETYHIIIRK